MQEATRAVASGRGLPVAKAHRGSAHLPVHEEVHRHPAEALGAAVQGHVVGVVPPAPRDVNGQTGNVLAVVVNKTRLWPVRNGPPRSCASRKTSVT